MKNFKLWKNEGIREDSLVVTDSDLTKVVDLSNNWYLMTSLDTKTTDLNKLNKKFAELEIKIDYAEELTEALNNLGYKNISATGCEDYEEEDDAIIYDVGEKEFLNLKDVESFDCFEYLDGDNDWQKEILFDATAETEVTVEDEPVDLDEWDGLCWRTNSIGHHEKFFKVISIDGEEQKDTYLLYFESQYQGEQDTAKIITKEELAAHLKELGRDLEEYELA